MELSSNIAHELSRRTFLNRLSGFVKRKYFETITASKKIDRTVQIAKTSKIQTVAGGSISIGKFSVVHDYAMILSYGGKIQIGDFCTVNPFCILYGHGGLRIGNGVRIAASTIIIPANHRFDDIDKFIFQQDETRQGIVIEDDVWIGAGTKILDGVRIGQGSVIGAGSVVTKNIENFTVVAGNPARIIRRRGAKTPPTPGGRLA